MKSLIRNSAITAILLAATAFAQADTYTYSGDTTGGNTFNRPVSLTTLSIVGTNVAYHELDFSVTTAGIYTFLSTTTSYDGFIHLYSTFDPSSPLSNLLAVNDDYVDTYHSSFSVYLAANTNYAYINSAFYNADSGAFSARIDGPGTVTAVPEPATYAMLLAGFALIGAITRKRMLN